MKSVVSFESDISVYADCNKLTLNSPFGWLKKGWQDFRRAPWHSLTYGAIFSAIGWLLVLFSQISESYFLLGLFISLLIIGPALAFGLYDISQQLEQGKQPSFRHERKKAINEMGHELMLALMLSLVFLAMLILTSLVVNISTSSWQSGVSAAIPMSDTTFFIVALVFAGVLFCANSFALPMILDLDINADTAMTSSLHAVWKNRSAIALWALLVLGLSAVGFVTGLIGFVIIVPVLGYATWHAYRETINLN
ncbi:MAG: DUF2189 domain-containing protein [Gammaproteobacteria bacterium]|nr:DUF2189 domain-containing protein [Gammaproteobacteria bacterium]